MTTRQIDDYLQRFREGDRDGAFFGLLEMDHEALPMLMAFYRAEPDRDIREFLVEVIWRHRQLSTIFFLGEALWDAESAVWKQALDGLVTLASLPTLDVLRAARKRQFPRQQDADEFGRWIDEAFEQVESQLQRSQE